MSCLSLSKSCLATCLFVLSIVCHAQQQNESKYNEDITLLKTVLEAAHSGYRRYNSEAQLAGMWTELEAHLARPDTSPLQVYAGVSKLLAGLKCDHTKAELPKDLSLLKKERFLPFRFKVFGQRMYVSSSAITELKRGDEITHINNVPVQVALSKLQSYMSVDGYTSFVAMSKLEQDYDLLGSGFEQFFAPLVLGLDNYPETYSVSIKSKDHVTDTSSLTVSVVDFDAWIKLSNRPYRLDFKDAVSVDYLNDNKTAILRVDTFVNYRKPVNAVALFETHFKQIAQNDIEHLIVDLRRNGGGSDDAQLALMRHLYRKPFQLVTGAWLSPFPLGELRTQLNSWDRRALDVDKTSLQMTEKGYAIPMALLGGNAQEQQPAEYAFMGQITVLSSSQNASASAALMAHIKQNDNVRVMGDLTGGNQGGTTATIMGFLTLPESKIVVRVPLILNQYNIQDPADGLGAIPDIEVSQTLDDWLVKKDTVLEHAKRLSF